MSQLRRPSTSVCTHSTKAKFAYVSGRGNIRRRSHYGRNDGDGTVTFRRSHFTLRNVGVNVTVAMAATVTVTMTAVEGVIQRRSERWQLRARSQEYNGIRKSKES